MHPHRRRERNRRHSDTASSNASNVSGSNDANANTTSGPENAEGPYNTTPEQRSSHTLHGSANDNLTRSNAPAQMDTLSEPIFANAPHNFGQSNEADASRSILLGTSMVLVDHPHNFQPRTPSQTGMTSPFYTRRTSSSGLPRSTTLDTNLADVSLALPLPTYNKGNGSHSSSSSTSGSAHGQPHPRARPGGQPKSYPLSSSEQRPLPATATETIPTTSTYPSSSMPMHSDSVSRVKPNAAGGGGFLANSVNLPSRNEPQGVVNDNHNNTGDMNSTGPTATSTNNIAVNLPHLNELFNTPVDAGFPLPSLGTDLNTHQLATDVDITAHSHLTSTGAAAEAVAPNYPSDSSFQPPPPNLQQPPSQSQPQPSLYSPQPLQPLYSPEHPRGTVDEMDERSRSHQLPQYYQGMNNPQQGEARANTTQTYHPPPYPPHPHQQPQQPQQFPQQPHHLRSTMQSYPQQDTERQSRQYVDRSRSSMRSVSHALPHADPSWPNPSQASAIQMHASSHGQRTHARHQSHPSPYPRSNISTNMARPSTSAIPPSSAQHGLQQWSPTMSGNAPSYPQSQPQQPQGNTVGPHRTVQRHRALSSPLYHHPVPAPYDSSPAQPPQHRAHEYRGNAYANNDTFEYEGGGYAHGGQHTQPQQDPYATSRNPYSAEEVFGAAGAGKGKKPKDPRPHKCTECGKGFPRPSALNTHMSVHSGEKPYRCPVVSCDKTFAVRSNARRHLKIHGIKLKTRDRSGGKKLDQERDATSDEELRKEYDQETGDEGDETSFSPKAALKSINAPAGALTRRVDSSRASAPHRGHTNTLGEGPLGIGAALSMLEFIPASTATATSTIAPSVKEIQVKRVARSDRQWVLQSSSAAASSKLRKQRESLSADRRRRGSRSEEQDLTTMTTTMTKRASVTTTIKHVTAKGIDNAYDPSSDDYADHEHDDDAEATGAEMDDEGVPGDVEGDEIEGGEGMTLVGPSATISIPQLDREALDKLIAPPTAWEGFQKQRKMAESGLSLDQRLQSHISASGSTSQFEAIATSYVNAPASTASGTAYQDVSATSMEQFRNVQAQRPDNVHGPQEAFNPVRHVASLGYRREVPSNTTSNEALHSTTNMSYALPSSDTVPPSYPIPSSSSATSGFNMPISTSSGPGHSSGMARLSDQMWATGSSAFLTSSMRSSAGGSVLPAHNSSNVTVSPVAGPSTISNPVANTTTATGSNDLGNSMVGEWRDDGTWIPRSMNQFQNVNRLRNQPPFDDAGLDEPSVNVPLSAMQPSQEPVTTGGTEQLHDIHRPNSHQQYHGRHRHHPYQQQRPRHSQDRTHDSGVAYSNNHVVGPYPYHPDYFNGSLPGPANNQSSVPTLRGFPIAV